MHTFDFTKYKEYTWDNEIMSYVSQIHEYRGKQDLYIRQKPSLNICWELYFRVIENLRIELQ